MTLKAAAKTHLLLSAALLLFAVSPSNADARKKKDGGSSSSNAGGRGTLEPVFEWSTLSYNISLSDATAASYDPLSNVLGSARVYGNRVYACVPRWRDGVPSTLNVIDLKQGHSNNLSPLLQPFPSLAANGVGNDCRNLQNVANYLILSLAVADLLVAVLVMPLGAVYEVRIKQNVMNI